MNAKSWKDLIFRFCVFVCLLSVQELTCVGDKPLNAANWLRMFVRINHVSDHMTVSARLWQPVKFPIVL